MTLRSRSELLPFQREMIDFQRRKRFWAVWALMGAGKTVSTLTAVSDLMDHLLSMRCLVVAPLRVANSVWRQEAQSWSHLQHLRVSVATGTEKQRRLALNEPADIYVINRENVPWLVDYVGIKTWPFDTVILDEASSFKNHQSKRWRALRRVRKHVNRIGELTGTPAAEGYIDLWAPMFLLDQGERLTRGITHYRSKWFESDYSGFKYTPREGAQEEIESRIQDIVWIVENYEGLPETTHRTVNVELSTAEMKSYRAFEKARLLEIADQEIEASTAAVLANKLLQYSQGSVYDEDGEAHCVHDRKIEALRDIVADANGEPVLVAYTFQSDLTKLIEAFPQARVLDKAGTVIDEWNAGRVPILLAHPQSAGHGLNLQAGGRLVVWYGLTWSRELYEQFNARLVRKGQKDAVIIQHLIATGTMDRIVMDALAAKGESQQALISAIKGMIDDVWVSDDR